MIYKFENKRPSWPREYYVADSATLIGDVEIGEQASIWWGAVLRGDIEAIRIGARSNIQDNSVAHTSDGLPVVLGCDVTVGHNVTLHGCTVGNNCLIGMGATLLDGSEIGDNCIIGAGALVAPGRKIPAGSLAVGSPARVIRTITADDILNIKHYADRYVDLQARYRKGVLKPLI